MKKHIVFLRAYFGISTKEANGIFMLNILFFCCLMFPAIFHFFYKGTPIDINSLNLDPVTNDPIEKFVIVADTGEKHKKPDTVVVAKERIKNNMKDTRKPKSNPYNNLMVNVNIADTSLLKQIHGIGTKRSQRIFKYRNLLGGFHSKEQYREVWGMDAFSLKELQAHSICDTLKNPLTKILVNKGTFKNILHHPYISYKLTQSIFNNRPFNNAAQFKETTIVSDSIFIRLKPYLSFER